MCECAGFVFIRNEETEHDWAKECQNEWMLVERNTDDYDEKQVNERSKRRAKNQL